MKKDVLKRYSDCEITFEEAYAECSANLANCHFDFDSDSDSDCDFVFWENELDVLKNILLFDTMSSAGYVFKDGLWLKK